MPDDQDRGGDPFQALEATTQASLVRSRMVSAREPTEAVIARCDRLEPKFNAVTSTRFDKALAEAAPLICEKDELTGTVLAMRKCLDAYQAQLEAAMSAS